MLLLNIFETTLPLTDPILKFLLILVIILFAPILLNKIKIPHLLGLIIAGAVIGPYGLYLMERDSSIILSGTAGLLYIMFLAGLEIDLGDFKKNALKSILLGLYGFIIPMALGTAVGIYILKYSVLTSVLMASMFASHTLITYPIVSKLGIAKNIAVNITVGSTLITNILALLVLAVVVGLSAGEMQEYFALRLSISFIVFTAIIMILFPLIGRWFFKNYDDNVSQYIFVLVMVYLGAVLSELAGIEGIIGAFLAGLSLNNLIPQTSPLMNRIDFVGNAIFIPFFLLGVGMLIDYTAFFNEKETLIVAGTMSVLAIIGKYLPAWLIQKTYGFTKDERQLIFGLSTAQAAATLAAVLVGYNIIVGETETGEPIRLLSESILNGTIIMILVTCTVASFVTQKAANSVALAEASDTEIDDTASEERILVPVSNIENIDELVSLAISVKSAKNKDGLYALSIINNNTEGVDEEKQGKKLLNKATVTASATDNKINELLRYDLNVINGITGVIKEHGITDLILGLHVQRGISDSFLGTLIKGILSKCNVTTLIYKPVQPLATVKRNIIVVPENAEKEIGFAYWVSKVWNIARNSKTSLIFYGAEPTLRILKEIQSKHPLECSYIPFTNWDDFLIISRDLKKNDNMIIILSRKENISYQVNMSKIPTYLNKYFQENSFILIYPMQAGVEDHSPMDINNPSFLAPIERIDEIGKTIINIFKKK